MPAPAAWTSLPAGAGPGSHAIDQTAYDAIRTGLSTDYGNRNAGLYNYANIGDLYINRIFSVSGGQILAFVSGYNFVTRAQGAAATQGQFAVSTSGGAVTAGGTTTFTLSPVPPGVNGSDSGHWLRIVGGTGAAEAFLVTGGTAIAGSATGTITGVCLNNHSGAWTLQSATAGQQEALQDAGPNATIECSGQGGTIYASVTVNSNYVTMRGTAKFSGTVATNGGAHLILANGVSDFTLDGPWLDSTSTNAGNVYDLFRFLGNNINTGIRNCRFTASGGVHGVNGVQCNVTGVRGIRITDSIFDSLSFGFLGNSAAEDLSDVLIHGNSFTSTWGDGVQFNIYATGTYVSAGNFRVIGNSFTFNAASVDANSGFAVGVAGPGYGVISNNTIHKARYQGIRFESGTGPVQLQGPRGWIVDGNQIDGVGTGFATQNFGIYLLVSQDAIVSNNVINGVRDAGIVVEYLTNTQVNFQTNITGNIVQGITTGEAYRFGLPPGPSATVGIATKTSASLNVIGNGAYDCAASGYHFTGGGGAGDGVNFALNIARGNVGPGVQSDQGPPTQMTWRDNDLANNTGGDIAFGTAGHVPIVVQGGRVLFTASVPAGGNSTYTNTIRIGAGMKGQLVVRVFDIAAASTSWQVALYDLTGTGPTITSLATGGSGVTLSAIAVQASGGYIQVRASSVGGGAITAAFDVQFVGSTLRN